MCHVLILVCNFSILLSNHVSFYNNNNIHKFLILKIKLTQRNMSFESYRNILKAIKVISK